MTLDQIKAECRKAIELGEKATPGPWRVDAITTSCGLAYRIGDGEMLVAGKGCCIIYDDYPSSQSRRPNSAYFIAHSRTFSPAAARALLTAIEQWESLLQIAERNQSRSVVPEYNAWAYMIQHCDEALNAITANWPEER